MNFQIALRLCFFFMLAIISVWSVEVTNFRWVKSDHGEFLCGMSPPNKTLNDVKSKDLCMSACFYVPPSLCEAINYWKNAKLCQHFYYIPCSYEVEPECVSYQVTIVDFHGFEI